MSDFPEAPDWWKATDGRWYAPPATPDGEPPASAPAAPPAPSAPGRSSADRIGLGCLVLVVAVIGGCVALSLAGDDDGGGSSIEAQEADAYRVCKDFVRDRLRSPGSAEFPDYFDHDAEVIVVSTGNGFRITSHVDSENGFGALLQTPWVCEVADVGDQWHLEELVLDG